MSNKITSFNVPFANYLIDGIEWKVPIYNLYDKILDFLDNKNENELFICRTYLPIADWNLFKNDRTIELHIGYTVDLTLGITKFKSDYFTNKNTFYDKFSELFYNYFTNIVIPYCDDTGTTYKAFNYVASMKDRTTNLFSKYNDTFDMLSAIHEMECSDRINLFISSVYDTDSKFLVEIYCKDTALLLTEYKIAGPNGVKHLQLCEYTDNAIDTDSACHLISGINDEKYLLSNYNNSWRIVEYIASIFDAFKQIHSEDKLHHMFTEYDNELHNKQIKEIPVYCNTEDKKLAKLGSIYNLNSKFDLNAETDVTTNETIIYYKNIPICSFSIFNDTEIRLDIRENNDSGMEECITWSISDVIKSNEINKEINKLSEKEQKIVDELTEVRNKIAKLRQELSNTGFSYEPHIDEVYNEDE
jgi:hypothetical protein